MAELSGGAEVPAFQKLSAETILRVLFLVSLYSSLCLQSQQENLFNLASLNF